MPGWTSHEVTVLSGDEASRALPARSMIVTEQWNRIVFVPYIVYMPEKDRVLMLMSCDRPSRPMVMAGNDHGETWSEPESILPDGPSDKRHWVGESLTYLGRGRLLTSATVCSTGPEGTCRLFSQDYGSTWSNPAPSPRASSGSEWNPWDPCLVDTDPATGDVIRLAETGYTSRTREGGKSQAFIRFSFDSGLTWSDEIAPPSWSGASEVALRRGGDGTVVAACRLNPPKEYWNAIDHYAGLGVSLSRDDGHTWTEMQVLYEWGRHHPSMVLLPNGDIVMTYVVRKGYPDTDDGLPQFGIEAVTSRDNGETWDMEHRYILAKWKGNTKGESPELENTFRAKWPRWWAGCQATSTVLLPDGSILTAFGTGYRSRPTADGVCSPQDVGLVKWTTGQT